MRVITWLESIFDANRIRPSRAERRCRQKQGLANYHALEDRRLLAADTLVSLVGGTLTITDISSASNDNLTISYAAGAYTIGDSSLALDSAIAGATGQGTSTLTVPDSGVDNITFDTLGGDDTITVVSFKIDLGDFAVLGSSGDDTVQINGDIVFAPNANLNLDLSNGAMTGDFDQISVGPGANLKLSGTGAATLVTSGGIQLQSGSSITTVDGNLTLSANQQATPTAGDFFGIEIDNALIEATGMGVVTVSGKGGDDNSGNQRGVYIRQNGDIIGGTSGVVIVTGIGGASSGRQNMGVSVQDSGSTITSNGAAVSVNGLGGGSGENSFGVSVFNGEIFATGLAPVIVEGTGSTATPDGGPFSSSIGVAIGASNPGSRIGSEDGNLTVLGTGMGAVGNAIGINMSGGLISSTGSGYVSLIGTGSSTGIGSKNYGIRMFLGSVISSNDEAIQVTVTGGADSAAFKMDDGTVVSNSNIFVSADSMIIDGSSSVTADAVLISPQASGIVIDLGGADVLGSTLGLTDAELDRITANLVWFLHGGGQLEVSAPISHGNHLLLSSATITINDAITMASDKTFSATSTGLNEGIVLATANADIATSGFGAVSLTAARDIRVLTGSSITTVDGNITLTANQQATPTAGNFYGVYIYSGLVEATGTGVVTVAGKGGDSGINGGVVVVTGNIIGGTSGLMTITGIGNPSSSGSSWGVKVTSSTVTSHGASVSVTGTGKDSFGIAVDLGGVISATNGGTVTLVGTGSSTGSGSNRHGVWIGRADGGTVSSNTGAIAITATASAGSNAFKMGAEGNLFTTTAGINVVADSMEFDGSSVTAGGYVWLRNQTIGVQIDLGGADVWGLTLGLTDVELDTITVSDGLYIGDASSGNLTVSAPITHENDLNLLPTSAGITVSESITLATDKHLYGQSGAGIVLSTASADIWTSGIGSVYLTTPRNISLSPGSSITTVDGNLTLVANQQTPASAGDFDGVDVFGGSIQSTGTGVVRIDGKGGDSGGAQQGVVVTNGGEIIGGTSGVMTVSGTGGASTGNSNVGVVVYGSGSTISSNGADISVSGLGGGSGNSASGHGVLVYNSAQIFALGAAAVAVQGTSFETSSTPGFSGGVFVATDTGIAAARIGTVDGDLTVTGTGMGTATGRGIIVLENGVISATGEGNVMLHGTGSATGTGTKNHGLWMINGGTVSSNIGAIEITATGGAGSTAFMMDTGSPSLTSANAPIEVVADSMAIDSSAVFKTGSSQTVTLRQQTDGTKIDLGGADQLGSTLGLTAAELALITTDTINVGDANSGNFIVSTPVFSGATSALNLNTGGNLIPFASGTDVNAGTATVGFEAGSDLTIDIDGSIVDSQYHQLKVVGQVNLTGVNLVTSGSHIPVVGEQFIVVDNDGTDAIIGTFSGLAEGAILTNFLGSGLSASISYLGTDGRSGNDAVLTVNMPPMVIGTSVINAGSVNRSGLGTMAITFDAAVNFVGPGSIRLFNHSTSVLVDTSSITPTGDGSTVLTWDLSSITFPDGRYTSELVNTQVEDLGGVPLSSSYAFELFVLNGDVDGDGSVNFNDYFAVSANFNQNGAAFLPGDADGDGSVNFNDYFTVSGNFNANSGAALEFDFGDAPDSATFPTLLPNGARHVITGNTTLLGSMRDAEPNGQATDGADEDGIVAGNLTIGSSIPVTVTASVSSTAFLNAWVDFNQDGDWDDAGEQVFTDQALTNGTNSISINVPANATVGTSWARFRITESAGYSYFGLAPNGEVEDYRLNVVASKGFGLSGESAGNGTDTFNGSVQFENDSLSRTLRSVPATQPALMPTFESTDDQPRRLDRRHALNEAAFVELAGSSDDGFTTVKLLELPRMLNQTGVSAILVAERLAVDEAFASDGFNDPWMPMEKAQRATGIKR